MEIIGVLGIILSLFMLMALAYYGLNVLVLAPITAVVALLFHPDVPILASYTQVFLPALGGFVHRYLPMFILGAIFGRTMSDSGAAKKIGQVLIARFGDKNAMLAVVFACAALTYGGVSVFVVAFTIYPIGDVLFQQANIPKRLLPGAITLGAFTFTMTAFPGTPAIHNAIPMPYFGTDVFAAPIVGLLAGVLMFILGMLWLNKRLSKARARGENYGEVIRSHQEDDKKLPSFLLSLAPLLMVVITNYLFLEYIIPAWDIGYLDQKKYGSIKLSNVIGMWALIASLSISVIMVLALLRSYLKNPLKSINEGTFSSMLPILNTASEVGYGAVIASLSSFQVIKSSVINIAPKAPLIGEAVAINILAGITGSASGGLSIALDSLGETFLQQAQVYNISPEILHRVASMASGGFDSLPHNGAVITLLAICGLSHKKSYLDIFMCATIFPFLVTALVVLVASFGFSP